MTFDYRDLTETDLHRLRELDRSEHVTTAYAMDSGSLISRAVDWDDSGWQDGDGEHSFAHQIDLCRGHVVAGARFLGCFTPPDQLVGIGVMRPGVEPGVAQLAFLHVSRAYRRRGIGTGLLDRLTAWAQGTGARELYVSATPSHSAVTFYQRAGFRVTDRLIEELFALEPEDIHLRRQLQATPHPDPKRGPVRPSRDRRTPGYGWLMEVLRLHGARDVRVHHEPEPVVAPGEELVRITAVGLCGSDLHWYEDGGIGESVVDEPLVLGHEMGGVIMSGPREGERVIVEPADPCGHCDVCRAGNANLCPDVKFCGHAPIHGGLRELMNWPQRLLLPAPDSIAGDTIALLEPLGIALHGIDLGHFRAGMSAGVYGAGPIGLFMIRALKAMGAARIVATDAKPHRVRAALASGADEAYLTEVTGQPDGIAEWPKVDVAFEVAGEDAALESALDNVRLGGRVVVVGIPPTNQHSFPAKLARGKGLTIAWSRRMKAIHMLRAIELADHGTVSLDGIITATYPLAEAATAFDDLVARNGLKIIVKPTE